MRTSSPVEPQPFGPLSSYIHRRDPTDEQYIEKLRTSLQWWDRWRWLGIAFYAAALGGLIYLAEKAVPFFREMQALFPNGNPNVDDLIIAGACVGFTLGFMLQGCVWGIICALSGLRSERLLVKYHDQQGQSESLAASDVHVYSDRAT